MKNNETGEFELVLGNRQLLSGFFIIVILFAVFFVMGYIVGRNSTPSAQFAANREQPGSAVATGDRPQAASGTAPASQAPAAAQQAPSNAPTEPAKDDSGTSAAASPQPTTQAAQTAPAKTEAPPPAANPAPVEPAPGETYLQVTAVKQDVAETVVRTLKDKGFPALLSPGPPGKTRVLVGPYSDLAKLGQAKAELEHLGFSPFVKR
ncbi:MAG TPA: SPOR domain-containing protein [Bryobacteraceae bacterium]|nr:SPOR domain-containing protein [Bryobacteraceae bacterium]